MEKRPLVEKRRTIEQVSAQRAPVLIGIQREGSMWRHEGQR